MKAIVFTTSLFISFLASAETYFPGCWEGTATASQIENDASKESIRCEQFYIYIAPVTENKYPYQTYCLDKTIEGMDLRFKRKGNAELTEGALVDRWYDFDGETRHRTFMTEIEEMKIGYQSTHTNDEGSGYTVVSSPLKPAAKCPR